VATTSRLLKNIGLFCKIALQKRPIFSKETYNFKEPTNRSHPICTYLHVHVQNIGRLQPVYIECKRECISSVYR